jgi:hypothetical protein
MAESDRQALPFKTKPVSVTSITWVTPFHSLSKRPPGLRAGGVAFKWTLPFVFLSAATTGFESPPALLAWISKARKRRRNVRLILLGAGEPRTSDQAATSAAR